MKLSSSVSYALGILLQVQRVGQGQPVTAARISAGCKFPPRYLYRVLRRLVDAGLLKGASGPGGGYSLARKPARINLLDIVTAVEGRIEGSRLLPVCSRHRRAVSTVNRLSRQIAADTRKELSQVNLAQLAET